MTELLQRGGGRHLGQLRSEDGSGRQKRAGPSVLDEIVERRRADVERELRLVAATELRKQAESAPPPRDALGPLLDPGLQLIAEIKRRSPSAGRLAAPDGDITGRARAYERGGASIVSVLVEPHWFGGSLADLHAVRAVVGLPVLAKEFVVDARQLLLLRAAGADLVLLLAALHPARRLAALVEEALSLGLEPLVEAHDARDLERALLTQARLIGVNNRDLRTLAVDAERAERLREQVPGDRLVVAESGVRSPATLRGWRALGFDAALVGEALMTGGEEAAEIAAMTAAFVAAGRDPGPGEDPAAGEREPAIKICGVTDRAGVAAALAAGATWIGLNFVPGTRRALSPEQAQDLLAFARSSGLTTRTRPGSRSTRFVGIFADAEPAEMDALAARLELDALQLSGSEPAELLAGLGRPVYKVLHLPQVAAPETDGAATERSVWRAAIAAARSYLALPNVAGIVIDTADPIVAGGTGRRADAAVAAHVAREVPVWLAGGLDAANVADALRTVAAIGVDVSSGVEIRPPLEGNGRAPTVPRGTAGSSGSPPVKDPYLVRLFVKRARAARVDRPTLSSRPTPVHPGLLDPDERGRWGSDRQFGGRYVPETLVAALLELEAAYAKLRDDPRFWAHLREAGRDYVGRPSPIYRADRLAREIERRAGRHAAGRLRLYLKREDLNHTGAHKINNALGQALLAQRLGKSEVIAETGAGQHGVATATACALLDLRCRVYMGAEDIRRQAPNVLRMRALGAEVRPVTSGSATLKDAINEAMRDWVTTVRTSHYVLGSAVGPHPYPTIVRDLQRVIGDEAAAQVRAVEGRLPDAVVACVGGGSNAIGIFRRFIGEPTVRLVGVEAAGSGISSGRHAAALAGGTPGVLHGSRSYLLQDADGQVMEAHSISAGLDYPGIGPQLSALYDAGRLEILAATDADALEALRLLTRAEGIIPALEPSHAIAVLPRLLQGEVTPPLVRDPLVLVGLSGRGDKDLDALTIDP